MVWFNLTNEPDDRLAAMERTSRKKIELHGLSLGMYRVSVVPQVS
jgi:hypothetical protein